MDSTKKIENIGIIWELAFPSWKPIATVHYLTVHTVQQGTRVIVPNEVLRGGRTGAGDGDRTRNQRLGKPLLYH